MINLLTKMWKKVNLKKPKNCAKNFIKLEVCLKIWLFLPHKISKTKFKNLKYYSKNYKTIFTLNFKLFQKLL